jgi:hypothetical protein
MPDGFFADPGFLGKGDLPFAGALVLHHPPFLGPVHTKTVDKVADYGKSKHRYLHFFIFCHYLPPFCGFIDPIFQKEGFKNDTLR